MSCQRGWMAIQQALRQVFLPVHRSALSSRLVTGSTQFNQTRSIVVRRGRIPIAGSKPIDPKSFGPKGYTKQVKDEDINGVTVIIADDNGNLGRPQPKLNALNTFDRSKYFLIKVSESDSGMAVCRVFPKEKIFALEKALNSTSKQSADHKKEIEIPWKSADGDIEHKLKLVRDFIEEGYKVDVVLIARKPRDFVRDMELARSIIDKIFAKLEQIEGVNITRDEASVIGKAVTFHIEAPGKQKTNKKKKEDVRTAKQLEMLWTITDEEIDKKRFRIAELLAAGIPVELTITSKKKIFHVSEAEGDQVMARIWAFISKIPGIQEVEPRQGETGKTVTLFLGTKPRQ